MRHLCGIRHRFAACVAIEMKCGGCAACVSLGFSIKSTVNQMGRGGESKLRSSGVQNMYVGKPGGWGVTSHKRSKKHAKGRESLKKCKSGSSEVGERAWKIKTTFAPTLVESRAQKIKIAEPSAENPGKGVEFS